MIQTQQEADDILNKYANSKPKETPKATKVKSGPTILSSANITFTNSSMGPGNSAASTASTGNSVKVTTRKPGSRQVIEKEESKNEGP